MVLLAANGTHWVYISVSWLLIKSSVLRRACRICSSFPRLCLNTLRKSLACIRRAEMSFWREATSSRSFINWVLLSCDLVARWFGVSEYSDGVVSWIDCVAYLLSISGCSPNSSVWCPDIKAVDLALAEEPPENWLCSGCGVPFTVKAGVVPAVKSSGLDSKLVKVDRRRGGLVV